ncbi:DMT family transporter [Paenibacillus sp. YYML68]|uniref:DMT family transporter n=1 Tax=Paenibacillus sp. YYML68 TaxID=2909250 RepID=UPI0024907D05|nr:DMT family transporter [Paenibacillus sp. YYML68]
MNRTSIGLTLVGFGAALWGTDAILRTPLLQSMTSTEIVLTEHLLLCLIAVPFLLMRRTALSRLSRKDWVLLLLISWGSSGLATWLFTEAFRHGNPSVVILLQKFQPLFAITTARLMLSERLPRLYLLLLPLALLGAYLLSFGLKAPFLSVPYEDWIGSLLAIGAALLWGCGTAFGRSLLGKLSFTELAAARFVFAVPFLLGLLIVQGGELLQAASLSASSWMYMVLLTFVPGMMAMLLYYRGLRETKASYATVAELFFPATAVFLNWVFLNKGITPIQLCGAAMIYTSVLLLAWRSEPVQRAGKLQLPLQPQ